MLVEQYHGLPVVMLVHWTVVFSQAMVTPVPQIPGKRVVTVEKTPW